MATYTYFQHLQHLRQLAIAYHLLRRSLFDRVPQEQVRNLVVPAKGGIEPTSGFLRHYRSDDVIAPIDSESDELQALFWVQNILTWHGGPEEQPQARDESRRPLHLVGRCQLLILAMPGSPALQLLA